MKSRYDLSECEVDVQNGIFVKKKSQHIMYYRIIFYEINILLLDYKKLNS